MELPAVDFGNVGLAGFVIVVGAVVAWRVISLWIERHDAREREQAEHQREMDKADLDRQQATDQHLRQTLEQDRLDRIAAIETLQSLVASTNEVVKDNTTVMQENGRIVEAQTRAINGQTQALNGLCEQMSQDHRRILESLG
jgi:hypothetical protein